MGHKNKAAVPGAMALFCPQLAALILYNLGAVATAVDSVTGRLTSGTHRKEKVPKEKGQRDHDSCWL